MLTRVPDCLKARLREAELDQLTTDALNGPPAQAFVLQAPAGTGKSVLLRHLHSRDRSPCKGNVIDASSPANRSRIGLACAIVAAHRDARSADFLAAVADARRSGSAKAARTALELFETSIGTLTPQQKIIYLDNIDRASEHVLLWLYSAIVKLAGPTLIGTARSATSLPSMFQRRPLAQFNFSQIELLTSHWASELQCSPPELAFRLATLSEGNAVRIMLGAWALQAVGVPNVAPSTSLDQLLWFMSRTVSSSDRAKWVDLIACRHRFTEQLALLLYSNPNDSAVSYEFARALPFSTPVTDSLGGVTLHQIAAERLTQAFSVTDLERSTVSKRLYDLYPRLMATDLDPGAMQALYLERLTYLSVFDASLAIRELQRLFDQTAQKRDISKAEDIAKVAESLNQELGAASPIEMDLLIADNAILENKSEAARTILAAIHLRSLGQQSVAAQMRYHFIVARCSTCPAPIIGADAFKAVTSLRVALEIGATANDAITNDLTQGIRLELANALRLIGRNNEALTHYEEVAQSSASALLRVRALEEEAQLLRLMQNLPSARDAINRANAMRFENQVPSSGLTTYYHANIRRDSGEFPQAEELYLRAETELIELGDDHAICELYGDYAWMLYLQDRITEAQKILEKGRRLAKAYGFGREMSEHAHMLFHFLTDDGRPALAEKELDEALDLAFQYGNIYMQLDCLMHMIQRQVRNKQLAETFKTIERMEDIEKQGSGIAVFRGRALIYQGDGLLEEGSRAKALSAWQTGFDLVARFGNSRTNKELLGDLLRPRKEALRSLCAEFAAGVDWLSHDAKAAAPELLGALRN